MGPAFTTIVEQMTDISDWEDRYGFLMDVGRRLPPLSDSDRNEDTRVHGCTSQVWIVVEIRDGILSVTGASDSAIMQGLLGILAAAYDGLTPDAASRLDVLPHLAGLDLDTHLTPQRSNGLRHMIQRIRCAAVNRMVGPA